MDGTREDTGTTDDWQRLAAAARPLRPADTDAIRRRSVPWWVTRVVAPGLVTALLVLEYVLADAMLWDCTVEQPCPAVPVPSLLEGLQLGAVAALWLAPRAGTWLIPLAAAAYWALVYVPDGEATTPAALACLAQVAVALVLLLWLAAARRAPLPAAGPAVRLPEGGRTRLVSSGVGTVEAAAVLGLVLALGLGGWWWVLDARTAERDARAVETLVEVVAVDEEEWVAEVRLPDGELADVGLLDLVGVDPGARLPARVDTSTEPAYVSLVSQPVEHDGWLVLAGLAATLGLGLAGHRLPGLRARARLLRRGGPVWRTSALADETAVVLPALGLAAPHARTWPGDGMLAGVGLLHQELDEASAARYEQEGRAFRDELTAAWRGEADAPSPVDAADDGPEQVLLLGDPRHGGSVVAVLPDAVLAPFGPLAPMSPMAAREVAVELRPRRRGHDGSGGVGDDGARVPRQGAPVDAPPADDDLEDDLDDDLDAHGLPGRAVRPSPVGVPLLGSRGRVDSVVLRQSPWRWSAAVSLVTLLAPWVLLTDWVWPVEPGDEPWRWWETAGVFAMGLYLGTLGLTFARTRVVLDRTGVHLRGGWLTRTVPWHETLGARVWDDDVLLLLGLDDEGDPDVVGGRVPRDLRADAVAAAAERWRLDAGPKGVRWQRPDPLLAGIAVVYAAAAVATVAGGYVT